MFSVCSLCALFVFCVCSVCVLCVFCMCSVCVLCVFYLRIDNLHHLAPFEKALLRYLGHSSTPLDKKGKIWSLVSGYMLKIHLNYRVYEMSILIMRTLSRALEPSPSCPDVRRGLPSQAGPEHKADC